MTNNEESVMHAWESSRNHGKNIADEDDIVMVKMTFRISYPNCSSTGTVETRAKAMLIVLNCLQINLHRQQMSNNEGQKMDRI